MSIVACPRCRDEVTLPAKISPQARVRCPLCRDEYILSEALAKMPPTLIVLDPGPGLDEPDYREPSHRELSHREPEYKVAGDAGMEGVFDSRPAMGDSPVSTMPRPGLTGKVRPKKKSGGGAVGQIIQVVLGGVGAFALFQPIAWYALKQDPFSMGPIVAKWLPNVVPAAYRGVSANTVSKAPPPVPEVVKIKKLGNSFDPGPQFNNLENVKPMLDPLDPGPAPPLTPEPEIKIDDPLKPPAEKPIDFTPPMPKPVDPNAKTPVSSLDVTTAFAFAVTKREDYEASVGEELAVRKQKGKDVYDAAAELGKLMSEADLMEPEIEDKLSNIKEFTLLMTTGGKRLTMLTLFSDERLAEGAKNDAIAIGGVIKNFKDLGATHEMTIEVTKSDQTLYTLPIVTTKSPEDDGAKVGDTAIVLGRIIRNPKKDLPKYKGEAPQVIQAGHTTLVPAAE